MLIKYIRTPKKYTAVLENTPAGYRAGLKMVGGDPIGVIVAIDRDQVGWSLCSPKDHFNKTLGKTIAVNRAESYMYNKTAVLNDIPECLRKEILTMYDRSNRYYQ